LPRSGSRVRVSFPAPNLNDLRRLLRWSCHAVVPVREPESPLTPQISYCGTRHPAPGWHALARTGSGSRTQVVHYALNSNQLGPRPAWRDLAPYDTENGRRIGLLTLDVNNSWRYVLGVIRTFRNKDTQAVFQGEFVRKLDRRIQQRAREKLKYLDSASELRDLIMPPSNQLEGLKGDRQGQHSIRINRQWRVCFRWKDGDAFDVEIADYH
jgi:proteic killer suppression protein